MQQKRAQRTERVFCTATPATSHVRSSHTTAAVGTTITTKGQARRAMRLHWAWATPLEDGNEQFRNLRAPVLRGARRPARPLPCPPPSPSRAMSFFFTPLHWGDWILKGPRARSAERGLFWLEYSDLTEVSCHFSGHRHTDRQRERENDNGGRWSVTIHPFSAKNGNGGPEPGLTLFKVRRAGPVQQTPCFMCF